MPKFFVDFSTWIIEAKDADEALKKADEYRRNTGKHPPVCSVQEADENDEPEMEAETFENLDQISITWAIEDVLAQAANDDIALTEDEAREILEDIKSNHDANYGVTWETVSHYIREFDHNRADRG